MEMSLNVYSKPGLYVEECIDFKEGKIVFHEGEESRRMVEEYGHSAFDRIIEYDSANIDKMIEALEKHYKEKQYSKSLNMEKFDVKQKKLLNLAFSFFTNKRSYYWEDLMIELFDSSEITRSFAEGLRTKVKDEGYQPKEVVYKDLSDLKSYFGHFGVQVLKDKCI